MLDCIIEALANPEREMFVLFLSGTRLYYRGSGEPRERCLYCSLAVLDCIIEALANPERDVCIVPYWC